MFNTSFNSTLLPTPLSYQVAKSSPYSGRYGPENILQDKPTDQSSRWSGLAPGNSNQWILLRLDHLSVLKSITFGKFYKPHPCNMKEFQVLVGLDDAHMMEVLRSSLKNDSVPETFSLRHVNACGVSFPARFIKIVPISFDAHGQSFHISIWHIALNGISDPAYVEEVGQRHEKHRETTVMKHILKHLRQRRLIAPYHAILERTHITLEHPFVAELHDSIVIRGDWLTSEAILNKISHAGLFLSYLSACQPSSEWTRLHGTDADGDVPSARGGHAMCLDPVNEMIYMFGGWDGVKSLDDFWVYSIKEDQWRVLSHSTALENNAPGPRSCHKMAFDTKTGSIYLLGRLSDNDGLRPRSVNSTSTTVVGVSDRQTTSSTAPGDENATPVTSTKVLFSEFYRYHTRGLDTGKWDFLSLDTATSGGPPVIFDHHMTMDCEAQVLYVFGGRVVDGEWDSHKYSGLYSYSVRESRWEHLLQSSIPSSQVIIPPRFGHSMVLEPISKTLYIFAGQKDEKYLSDMYAYDIKTNSVAEIFSNYTDAGGPDSCFTQRAVINPEAKEIYVFCGLTRNPSSGAQPTLQSYSSQWVYRYNTQPGEWARILCGKESKEHPSPRFAHQVVYNPTTGIAYLHGGNAGGLSMLDFPEGKRKDDNVEDNITCRTGEDGKDDLGKERRLDDFWRMELKRPSAKEVIRRATFRLRRQQFKELCIDEQPIKALQFLKTSISEVVDHDDSVEEKLFRSLLIQLLSLKPSHPINPTLESPTNTPKNQTSLSPMDVDTEMSSSPAPSPYHDDTRSDSNRPRKRSRPNTPATTTSSGSWTSSLSDDDITSLTKGQNAEPLWLNAAMLQASADPVEYAACVDFKSSEGKELELSAERYRQRTEVFESILEYIEEGDKQPEGQLIDLIDH